MQDQECIYKYELAIRLRISTRTLSRWLNIRYYNQLTQLGYQKHQKYLTPVQIKFLQKKLDF